MREEKDKNNEPTYKLMVKEWRGAAGVRNEGENGEGKEGEKW